MKARGIPLAFFAFKFDFVVATSEGSERIAKMAFFAFKFDFVVATGY